MHDTKLMVVPRADDKLSVIMGPDVKGDEATRILAACLTALIDAGANPLHAFLMSKQSTVENHTKTSKPFVLFGADDGSTQVRN